MQLSRLAWTIALCALIACDKNSNAQPGAGSGGAGSAADGGSGATAGASSDAGGPADQAGRGDPGGQAGKAGGGQAGRAPSQGGAGGAGGSAGPQGGDGASAGESGAQASGGTGGASGAAAGSGGTGGTAGAGGIGATVTCVPDALCEGPKPDAAACGATPMAIDMPITDINCPGKRTCVGASAPRYTLTDYQDSTSCGTHATYGLDAFRGQTTLVCIFATWCDYCKAQAPLLSQLRLELHQLNKDIQIVIINEKGYSPEAFADLTYGPVLQDVPEVDAWKIHGVEKDDLLIYRADGTLEAWLQPGQMGAPIDLTKPDGYEYVKMRLLMSP